MRAALLAEAERVNTTRLLMERVGSDLRSAQASDFYFFRGTSNSIQFVKLNIYPSLLAPLRTNDALSDLSMVSYQLVSTNEGTNDIVLGVNRSETMVGNSFVAASVPVEAAEDLLSELAEAEEASAESAFATNAPPEVLTDLVRGLQFRYWDGSGWTNDWRALEPPGGVELTVSWEPLDLEQGALTNAVDVFRRVFFVPAGKRPVPASETLSTLTF